MPSSAGSRRLNRPIRLRSLILDFPCAILTTPIAPDSLYLHVPSVGRMVRLPNCASLPSAGFIRLILLRSLILDFPCTTQVAVANRSGPFVF